MEKSTRRIIIDPRSIVLTIAIILALLAIRRFLLPLALILVAIIIAAAIEPAVRWLGRWHLRRLPAILLLSLCGVGLLYLFGYFAAPQISSQASSLRAHFPMYQATFQSWFARLKLLNHRYHLAPSTSAAGSKISAFVAGQISGWLQRGLQVGVVLAEIAADAVLVVLMSFFMLLQAPELTDGLVLLFPASQRPSARRQLDNLAASMGAYVRGQLLSMAALAIILALGLSLIHEPYAWLLALISGGFEIIPWLGGFVGVILAIMIAATVSWKLILLVVLVFALAHFIQGDLLGPYIQSRVVLIPPAIVLIALLLGGELLGLLGAIIAVPVTAMLFVLVRNLYLPLMGKQAGPVILPGSESSASTDDSA